MSCAASRREKRGQTRRLAPVGLPSLAQRDLAGAAGRHHEGGPSRGQGSRALMSVAGSRPTIPLDELARCSRPALRVAPLPCAALEPDRPPGHPPRPVPGRPKTERPNCLDCPLRLDRRASRCAWCHVGRRAAAAGGRCGRFAVLCDLEAWDSACASGPTALPPTAPPSDHEGDLWGDLQAVGRVTGSLLRLR